MAKKNWIAGAVEKPGALRKTAGVKKGEKITLEKLKQLANSPNKTTQKRANLALTFKKMK